MDPVLSKRGWCDSPVFCLTVQLVAVGLIQGDEKVFRRIRFNEPVVFVHQERQISQIMGFPEGCFFLDGLERGEIALSLGWIPEGD